MKQLLSISKARNNQQSVPIQPANLDSKIQSNFIYQDHEDELDGPSEEEIRTYAEILGIKLPEEEYLLYLAKECLMEETPEDWRCEEDESGEIIYINIKTGETSFEHPQDQVFRQKVIAERKKRINDMKKGMTKISIPKSKTSFVQNIFKTKPQQLTTQQNTESNQYLKNKDLSNILSKSFGKKQKNDEFLYDDQIQIETNVPIKQHKKVSQTKVKDNVPQKVLQKAVPLSKNLQNNLNRKEFVQQKQNHPILMAEKKKQIQEKMNKKYKQLNEELDNKYIQSLKQCQQQQNKIRQLHLEELKQKVGFAKVQGKRKQIETELLLEHSAEIGKLKLEAQKQHRKDILILSSKYQIQQLFTQMSQCRNFLKRNKLQSENGKYLQEMESNIKAINRIQIEKIIAEIQKQSRSRMHMILSNLVDGSGVNNIKQEEQQMKAVDTFREYLFKIISRYEIQIKSSFPDSYQKQVLSPLPQTVLKETEELCYKLDNIKLKLNELREQNSSERGNLSDRQSKLFDLLQNKVVSSSRSSNYE